MPSDALVRYWNSLRRLSARARARCGSAVGTMKFAPIDTNVLGQSSPTLLRCCQLMERPVNWRRGERRRRRRRRTQRARPRELPLDGRAGEGRPPVKQRWRRRQARGSDGGPAGCCWSADGQPVSTYSCFTIGPPGRGEAPNTAVLEISSSIPRYCNSPFPDSTLTAFVVDGNVSEWYETLSQHCAYRQYTDTIIYAGIHR